MLDLSIVWFRQDLRLSDNLALLQAATNSKHILPLFIWSPDEEGEWAPGAASRWWLHHSLQSLDEALKASGSKLILRNGNSLEVLQKLIGESGAKGLFFNCRYDPAGRAQEDRVQNELEKLVLIKAFNSSLLHNPELVFNKEGNPFKVFTPYWNNLQKRPVQDPAKRPESLPFPDKKIASEKLETLDLLPKINWAGGIAATWKPGEKHAQDRLQKFIEEGLWDYSTGRDRPDQDKVSMISPYLHFGEIGPRQIHHIINKVAAQSSEVKNSEFFLKEMAWREFAHYVLYHFPETANRPLRSEFERFPWAKDAELLRKWEKGETGFPIIDAGMRQLWHTGWMHNRVRMIVASFLTKDLLISWNHGARWFWDTLVDADLANNTLGWQWAGGCGADAAPYFRIFNPTLQSEKFDPNGAYIRRWVPELEKLPAKWLYTPSEAPADVLATAKIKLGTNYPRPIVDHSEARKRALAALATIKK